MIKTVQKYYPNLALSSLNLWVAKGLMLLSILGGLLQSTTVSAGTTVALSESYAGNLSFALTAGSFRTQSNNSNACTINSESSSPFTTLPSSATVIKAYLYWTGSSYNNEIDSQVYLNSSSNLINATRTYTEVKEDRYFYNGIADITNYVNSNKSLTTYTVGGVDIENTGNHCSRATVLGGWALLVIYEDDSEDFRVLNLYEGFEFFQNESFDLVPNNFKLPNSPSGKHAHITWEGDDTLGTDGEFLAFEGVRLTDSNNPSDNQFNSFSNIENGLTTYGVDVDEYDISTYLNEGDESVTTTYSAGQDLIILSAEIISVSNIPVADLAVTTSTPTGWQANSTITKKFTISNNGPNDVPAQSARFITTLPSSLTFNGTQGDSNWVCAQTGQELSCIFQSKLRSGWSDYLDLTFDVGDVAGTDVSMNVSVDHESASYDIFDNQEDNNTYEMTIAVTTNAVVDLSASNKVPTLNSDVLLAGDTLEYIITIDDASDLEVSGIVVTDELPSNITGYNVKESAGGSWSITGNTLTFSNINLAAGTGTDSTKQIIFEVYIDENAEGGASLQNQATISYDSTDWIVDTGDITVVEIDFTPSSKDVYDVNAGILLPTETVRYTITIEDTNNLEISGIQVTDTLPSYISSFTVVSKPTNSIDNSDSASCTSGPCYIDISNISINSTDTASIIIDAVIDSDTPTGTSILNTATVLLNSKTWSVISNELIVNEETNTPASGNKPLYLLDNILSRNKPDSDSSVTISSETTEIWQISPNIQSDLTLSAGTIRLDLAIEGNQTNNNRLTTLTVNAYYNDGSNTQLFASGTFPEARWDNNEFYDESLDLTLASEITIPAGSTIYLSIHNSVDNSRTGSKHAVIIHRFNNSFYSQLVLDAATVINVDSITVWDTTYGNPAGSGDGSVLANSQPDTNLFIRAVISDPFGAFDISSADISIVKSDATPYTFDDHPDGNTNLMNQVDDTSDDLSSSTKTFEKEITLLETGEDTGYWTITIKGYEGLEVGDDQITHQRDLSFWIKPFLPNITLTKSITVINDPINGSIDDGANPKAIPGAELRYTINAINSGRGQSDDGSLILQDEIPLNSDLYIDTITCSGTDTGPVCFQEGDDPSGLSFTFSSPTDNSDDLFFSTDGTDFTHTPTDSGDGYDPAIRYIRMTPANPLNSASKDGTVQPEFNFHYQIRLN